MPTRNVVKTFVPNAFFHVYNRGWNKGKIFLDEDDYDYFESLLARYLSPESFDSKTGDKYNSYYPYVHLLAYCLMGNHFHLLIYQYNDPNAITHLMWSLTTAYISYFNKRHQRRGSLFESTYKAVWISRDDQLMHISRYIHLDDADYQTWRHSSYNDYLGACRDWVDCKPILELFPSVQDYVEFVDDYEELKRERDGIKDGLYGK